MGDMEDEELGADEEPEPGIEKEESENGLGVKINTMDETHRVDASSIADIRHAVRKNKTFLSRLPWRDKEKKHHSNPPGWPDYTLPEVLEQRPHRNVYIGKEQQYIFGDNFVKTSRYEWYSFLPVFLVTLEFNPKYKISNVYFLCIAFMQLIPPITNTFGIPIIFVPLSIIVVIDMVFAITEDVTRHRADAAANSAPTQRLDRENQMWRFCQWWQLDVGDIVLLRNLEEVPADIIILGVHEPHAPVYSGCCYVETKSLDGETNLKVRSQIKPLLGKMRTARDASSLVGKVTLEHPNKIIHQFTGTIKVTQARNCPSFVEPIGPENLVLRGTVIRNTKWVYGLVVNTGHDTKVMMAMTKRMDKSSQLNARITEEIKGIAILLMVCCLVGALGGTIFNAIYNRDNNFWYLDEDFSTVASLFEFFVIQFFNLFLLLYGFIPISLYVTQNFVRFFQAMFMNCDLDMYHEETDTPMRVRTMNLNEDLGQISHVFSDKTGTLTENVMDFRKVVIAGKPYGLGKTEIGAEACKSAGKEASDTEKEVERKSKEFQAPHVNFYDPKIFADMYNEDKEDQARAISEFFRVLALCHTVIPEKYGVSTQPLAQKAQNGGSKSISDVNSKSPILNPPVTSGGSPKEGPPPEVMLSASSPDEEALVLGAKYFGYEFCDRVDSVATLRIYDDITQETANNRRFIPREVELHDVNHIFSFNSNRKRMSVVIKRPDGRISLLCKGADTTVIPLLKVPESGLENRAQDDTISLMEIYANEGLRTLVIASKDIPQEVYDEWDVKYRDAMNDVTEREKKNLGKPNLIDELATEIEKGLSLLGVTAIEDRLQKGVGETIEKLIRAGITMWIITGDKEETAINIGVACRLIWPESRMERVIINTKLYPTADAIHKKLLKEFNLNAQEIASSLALGTWSKPRVLIIDGPAFELIEDSPAAHTVRQSRGSVGQNRHSMGSEKGSSFNIEEYLSNADAAAPATATLPEGNVSAKDIEDEEAESHDVLHRALEAELKDEEGTQISTQEAFLQLATVCQAVVGCRMSPDQKRQLVQLVKTKLTGARTLSIGDGANDVPMIQAAHVGIGISGQEGLQAVNASDYAFAQFRFLQKLLLCHGRYNYWRMSLVTTYLFYKSIVWGVPLAAYTFFNSWSGQFFYDYISSNLWALFYTSLPIVLFGIYDMDVSQETCLKYPWLYRTGLSDNFLRSSVFWGWVMQGVLEGIWITLVVMFGYSGGPGADHGATPSNLMYGNTCFAIVTMSVNMKMIFIQHRWHWVEPIVLVCSTLLMWLFGIAINKFEFFLSFDWDFFGTMDVLARSEPYWTLTAIGFLGILCRDVAWRSYHRWWQPKLHHILVEMEVTKKDSVKLPEALRASYEVENIVAGDAQERLEIARRISGLGQVREEQSLDSASLGYTVTSSLGQESAGPSSTSPRSSIMRPISLRMHPSISRRSCSQLGMHALLHRRAVTMRSPPALLSPGEPQIGRSERKRKSQQSVCAFSEDEVSAALQARRILSSSSSTNDLYEFRRRSSLPLERTNYLSRLDSSNSS